MWSRFSALEADREMDSGSTHVKGKGQKQYWAEEEVKL